MGLLKDILISNAIMLLVPLIALRLQLFSNQIHLLYHKSIIGPNDISQIVPNQLQIVPLSPMPLHSRYILSHCQFDGMHFLANNYNCQPNFAFIKGYTTLVHAVKSMANIIHEQIDSEFGSVNLSPLEIQVLILLLINKILFSLSALQLQQIALFLTKNPAQSSTIAKLFLYNPACIFFHSVYTQSIYAFLTFTAVLELLKSSSNINSHYAKALGCLSLAVFFRTNGIFLAPVFGIPIIFQLWSKIINRRWKQSMLLVFRGLIVLAVIIWPFLWYQHFAYQKMCASQTDLMEDKALREECAKSLPNVYNFVQKKFWSVGFLSYWKLSNSLFIMLGLPAILLSLGCFKGTIKDLKGLLHKNVKKKEKLIKYGLEISFMILTLITVFLTNIQSSTRFFSSHVFFYMILGSHAKSKWLELWIWTYLILGGILFCIGFPWT